MDAASSGSLDARCNMTIAEKTTHRTEFLRDLRSQIRDILLESSAPMSLSTIEAYLNHRSLMQRGIPGIENTFDVRDAVSELVEEGEAQFTIGRKIHLLK